MESLQPEEHTLRMDGPVRSLEFGDSMNFNSSAPAGFLSFQLILHPTYIIFAGLLRELSGCEHGGWSWRVVGNLSWLQTKPNRMVKIQSFFLETQFPIVSPFKTWKDLQFGVIPMMLRGSDKAFSSWFHIQQNECVKSNVMNHPWTHHLNGWTSTPPHMGPWVLLFLALGLGLPTLFFMFVSRCFPCNHLLNCMISYYISSIVWIWFI